MIKAFFHHSFKTYVNMVCYVTAKIPCETLVRIYFVNNGTMTFCTAPHHTTLCWTKCVHVCACVCVFQTPHSVSLSKPAPAGTRHVLSLKECREKRIPPMILHILLLFFCVCRCCCCWKPTTIFTLCLRAEFTCAENGAIKRKQSALVLNHESFRFLSWMLLGIAHGLARFGEIMRNQVHVLVLKMMTHF